VANRFIATENKTGLFYPEWLNFADDKDHLARRGEIKQKKENK
jgi:hypothetical protein